MTGTSSARAVRTCVKFLKDNPQITEEIGNKVKAEFGLIEVPDQFVADGESATDGDAPETAPEDGAPSWPPHRLPHDQRRSVPRRSWNM